MAGSNVFPAIIKVEYQGGGNAFPALARDIDGATQNAAKKFESAFGQIQKAVESSLSRGVTAAGGLDLGVREANQAAEAAQRRAEALREVARAARSAADAERNVPALNVQARAAAAAAIEARNFARETAQQALALDRLQIELDQTSASTRRFTQAQAASVGQTAAGRQSYQNLGFQISDITQSLALGISPFVVFGQQAGQTAAAVSGMGGVLGRVGGFLAGPFGSIILGAVTVVGLLGSKMLETADATDDAGKAAQDFASRQLDLSNFIDKTTGKLIEQNATLRENAILLRQGEISKKQNAILDRRETAFDIASRAAGSGVRQSLTGREGITVAQQPNAVISGAIARANGNAFALKKELEALNNPKLKSVIQQIGQLNAQSILTARDVKRLGLENVAIGGGAVDKSLLNEKKGRSVRSPKGPSAETLANREFALGEFGRDASDKISGIRDKFGDAPSLIQRQAAALRELADIQTDLEKRKPPKLDEYLAQLAEAKGIIENSLSKPFQEILATAREQAAIDGLVLEGREIEAEILQRSLALQKQKGSLTKAEIEGIGQIVKQERLRSVEMEKRNESIARYQRVVSATYASIEDLLSGGKADDFFKSLKDQFNQLRGQNLAESLFGDAFRELKNFTERNNPQNVAVRNLVEQTDTVAQSLKKLANALTEETSRISGAANDNFAGSTTPTAADGIAPQDLIVVTGSIRKAITDGNRYSFGTFASATAASIINPLLAKLDDAFGVKFFGQLSGTLTGALAGFARAGKVGGVLGAGQGLFDSLSKNTKISQKSQEALSKISSKFGDALGGAQTGDQTAQLLRSFGIKTSRLGGQIGGAVGSVAEKLGIPGGEIIGSIIGSVVGGLFKKTKKGSTTISNLTDDLSFTGSGKLKESTLGLGNNVKASLSNIIEQLGGTAGTFSVSVGQRGKNFVVDTSGQGKTKGSGVQKFKTQEEAQRAALLDAIKDGAVAGIKAGAQRLLQAGKDLDVQLQKAIKFQSVFDRLDAIKNPLGSAINTLNREFTGLISIFKEAGASAEEFASLEELYGLERARVVKEQSEALTNSLRGLIADLTQGDNGLALRDRLANIRAEFNPLAATIQAGGSVDFDKFSELSRQLIEVQRQISGSQPDYFRTFDEVLALSRSALAGQENVISIGSGSQSPFSGNAAPSNASTPVVGAIANMNDNLGSILNAINANIGNLGRNTTINAPSQRFALGGNTYF